VPCAATPSLSLGLAMTRTMDDNDRSYEPDILVVDDDDKGRYATVELLRPLGCRVVQAASGDEALRLCEEHTFALVLLDVHMPVRDGFDTACLLRERGENRRTPIIFLSADHDPAKVRRAYASGASDYLAKPYDPVALLSKVDVFMALHRRTEELRRSLAALRNAELASARADDALESAEERHRLRDVFIGILGHDLRNPLGAAAMGAQILLSDVDLSPKARTVAAKILKSTERMSALIRDVLDFARGQLGDGIPIIRVVTNMAHACEAVVEEHRLRTPARGILLEVRDDLRGRWDRERVEQALSNLVSNALQHGDGDVRVSARALGDPDDSVVVEVHNGGAPIPAELLPTVFEPFRKADTSAAGLGLGLYVVREIARAHRAALEVVSDAEAGTTFRITWPRHSARPSER
jgi:signal transduction histidine kinase